MLKPQKIDISQTNLANFGTELEKNIKRAAADGEAAWSAAGVGTAVGKFVWRIEKFKVVPHPKVVETGTFHLGDSYVVLSSTKKGASDGLQHAIHFWLGADTTQDEAGTAAYKTVELDDKLGGAATQFRECSGAESAEFLALFPNLNYAEGGVDTGFKHVERDVHRARLLAVKGTAVRIVVTELPKSAASLNHGDAFLADAGSKLFVFNGQSSSQPERQAAAALARAIKDERGGKCELVFVDGAGKDETEFFQLLGGTIDDVKPAKDDDSAVVSPKVLLRLNDGTAAPSDAAAAASANAAPAAAADAPPTLAAFNAELDADLFHQALDHLIGYDKAKVVALLSQRDRAQLQAVAKQFSSKHGRELGKDLRAKIGALNKDARSLVELLLAPKRVTVDAIALNQAVGVVQQVVLDDVSTGTFAKVKKSVLVDIIVNASVDPTQMKALGEEFKRLTHATLQVVVDKKAAGGLFSHNDFHDLALELLKGGRPEVGADAALTTQQAARLLKASEGRVIGVDVASFIDVFAHSSLPQIAATVAEVEKTSKKHAGDFAGLLDAQRLSKSFKGALLYLVALAQCKPEVHFARRLRSAMKGLGTDAIALNYVVVSMREAGAAVVERTKAAFFTMFGNTLSSWIKDDASGLWRTLLLALVGPEKPETYGALAKVNQVTFEIVARGDEVKRELLKSDDVFVLFDGHSCWAWCGRNSSAFEKKVALQYAQNYLAAAKLPATTPIIRILEGGHNAVFEASFA